MPFRECSRMDERRRMVFQVLQGTLSVSAASREFGVSRQVVRLWVERAQSDGLDFLSERSRRPHTSPRSTDPELVRRILSLWEEHEDWGASILWNLLGGSESGISVRTIDRILERHDRRLLPPRKPKPESTRFEKEHPNELWQSDFKRIGPRQNRSILLTILDDCTRFNLALVKVPDETFATVWKVLWDVFGSNGLPGAILTDNGSAFRNNATWRYSTFDLMLMLLDIRPIHGRPRHPQTQGKVERYHKTLEWEVGRKLSKHDDVVPLLEAHRNRYNWVRPHDANNGSPPGAHYTPSTRTRPHMMPEPFFPDDAIIRQVSKTGFLYLKGKRYDLGNALAGRPIGLLYEDLEFPKVVWGNFILGGLQDFLIS